MLIEQSFGLHLMVYFVFLGVCLCLENCDRRPLGTKTQALPPDNRFFVEVNTTGDEYIPNQAYKVHLHSANNSSTFIAFTIFIEEDTAPNDKNPRKPKHLDPGHLHPSPTSEGVVVHPNCSNTVQQQDITPKTSVEALWIAPSKDNKCVTVCAVVAVKPDVWYSFEGPLSKRVCENRRKADDIQPLEIMDCKICEEARYQMFFEGMWSANTHPLMFPNVSLDLVRFSDVVGASHNRSFILYKDYSEASPGLKMLAEQGNTTDLEMEIIKKLGESVRTVIKATGPPKTNATTVASFRVSPTHHLVSIATALVPSPDWFLGVSNMELCTGSSWAERATLNLYPMDAGTDSGLTFGSANEDTLPPQPISEASINKGVPKEDRKPFARLRFRLIRTYPTSLCESSTTTEEDTGPYESTDEEPEKRVPLPPRSDSEYCEYKKTKATKRSAVDFGDSDGEIAPEKNEEPTTNVPDPDSTEECPMTVWSEWDSCDGSCENGVKSGFHARYRKIIENVHAIPAECQSEPTEDFRSCEESCEEETTPETTEDEDVEAEALYRWRRWKPDENKWKRWNGKK